MQQALDGLEGISIVADDKLIIGRGESEAEVRRDHYKNLKLSKAKIKLHMTEISYIGHMLTQDGVKSDPEKVAEFPHQQPSRFLGFTNFLTKFRPNLAAANDPLRRLQQKDAEFE